MFCPECGANHHSDDEVTDTDVTIVDNTITPSEVEIARINAQRDIKLAQIQAGVDREALESELAALQAELRGYKEGVETVVDPVEDSEEQPAEDDSPDVVVVDDDTQAEPESLPEPEPVEHHRKEKPRGLGMW